MGSKGKGVLSYLLGWIGGLIVLFGFKDNNRRDVFHACQAITISVGQFAIGIVIGTVNGVLIATAGISLSWISTIVNLLCFVLEIMGLVKVLKDDPDPKLPVVGDLAEKIFEKKINATPEYASAPQANFDPNTGQSTQPQANFDPNTGQPVNQPAPQANFDPNTGKPVNQPTDTPNQNF